MLFKCQATRSFELLCGRICEDNFLGNTKKYFEMKQRNFRSVFFLSLNFPPNMKIVNTGNFRKISHTCFFHASFLLSRERGNTGWELIHLRQRISDIVRISSFRQIWNCPIVHHIFALRYHIKTSPVLSINFMEITLHDQLYEYYQTHDLQKDESLLISPNYSLCLPIKAPTRKLLWCLTIKKN